MPWKESKPMDERLRFVARILNGEQMTAVCKEFGISRKTGYKIFNRYKEQSFAGLVDQSRRPHRQPNRLPVQVEAVILRLKQEFPTWGAPKIRERLAREFHNIQTPAISTVHAVLDRNGLVKPKKKRRYKATGTPLVNTLEPNGLWCADFKGEFKMGNREYCYPLTITDYASRYLLACEGQPSTQMATALPVFERAFQEFGLPRAIRTDNGLPFASPNALFGLSQLSIWWLRLGIRIERIKPGNPQENGRHERMHRTLKDETTKPAQFNLLQQQSRFDQFIEVFNNERPHQGIAMRYPAELYTRSPRVYQQPNELEYPFHDREITVTKCGRICIGKRKISLSQVFAGQKLGIRQEDDQIWSVTFMDYEIGYFDGDVDRICPADDPFSKHVLPMSSV